MVVHMSNLQKHLSTTHRPSRAQQQVKPGHLRGPAGAAGQGANKEEAHEERGGDELDTPRKSPPNDLSVAA